MANEVVYSGHAGLFNAAAVTNLAHLLLADLTDLRALCEYKGSINGRGTSVIEVPRIQAAQAMAATSEVSDAANQDYTTSSINITVSRHSIVREPSDLFLMAGAAGGMLDLQMIAQSVFKSATLRFTDVMAALFPSVTAQSGASGVALSVDHIYDAQNRLQIALVPGDRVACVLAPKQLTQFRNSLRTELGLEVYREQNDGVMRYSGPGYAFTWNGIDFVSCDSVTNDGTNFSGAMFGYGAFAYADGMPDPIRMSNEFMGVAPDNSAVWVELHRNARKGTFEVIGDYYFGASLQEDARAVEIISAI